MRTYANLYLWPAFSILKLQPASVVIKLDSNKATTPDNPTTGKPTGRSRFQPESAWPGVAARSSPPAYNPLAPRPTSPAAPRSVEQHTLGSVDPMVWSGQWCQGRADTNSSGSNAHEAHGDHHVRHKPLKRRGLSKFYSSKSQSFSSLELALSTQYGDHALGLAKGSLICDSYSTGGSSQFSKQHGMLRSQTCTSEMSSSTTDQQSSMELQGTCWLVQRSTEDLCSDLCRALQRSANLEHGEGPAMRRVMSTDFRAGSGSQLVLPHQVLAGGQRLGSD